MTLPIIHDAGDAACRCHGCCHARYAAKGEAERQAELERERLAVIARAEREYQLRLPMAPIPHCAGQPRSLARDLVCAARPVQLEL